MQGATNTNSALVLRSLYRRLLKCGEDGRMMQRCLSVNSLSLSLQYGKQLLHMHNRLTAVDAEAVGCFPLRHPLKRARLAVLRRRYAWGIFSLRLKLRGKNAISDALVYTLFLIVCVLLYCIYRTCRVGVTRAEERYRTLSIPIMQTFAALEAAEQRKLALQKEMEEDIVRQR